MSVWTDEEFEAMFEDFGKAQLRAMHYDNPDAWPGGRDEQEAMAEGADE